MRGFASVLTVAFVFASASLLLGQAAGQSSTEPAPADPPQEYRQPAPDAYLQGVVSGPKGPVVGASVSTSNYGSPRPMPAEDPASDPDSPESSESSDAKIACYDCYWGGGYNSTVTDESGRYFLGVWSGENQISVHHNDFVGHSQVVTVAAGETATQDITLQAYPEKTSHIVGKVTDAKTGKGLGFAYVSVRSPQYGPSECSQPEGTSSGSGGSEPGSDGGGADASMVYPYEPRPCAITIRDDGSFEGDVTPGYTILSVYAYQDCSTSRDADGGGTTTCGPEYLQYSRTLTLPANQTTRVDVALQSRPSPDATVSGYLVDAKTGKAIPGGSISFNSQETYAYGHATTDSDGSFKIRLRSGYHTVYAYAEGHLSWEGVLQVKAGSSDFDVKMTPGQEQWGGSCCYAMEKSAVASDGAAVPPGSPSPGLASNQAAGGDDASEDADSGESYEDLGGGLGPYDPEARSQATANEDGELEDSDKGAPAPGLLLALAALLGAVLVLRRRKA